MKMSFSKRRFMAGALSALIAPPKLLHAAEPVTHVVEIQKLVFLPDVVVVRPGDRIRWINRDIAPHTATALNRSWDTGRIAFGEEVVLPVTQDLATDYYCAFHPHMWGTIRLA